jgi:hypothetical protein
MDNIRSYLPRSEARKLVDCLDQVGAAKEVLAHTVTPRDQAQPGPLPECEPAAPPGLCGSPDFEDALSYLRAGIPVMVGIDFASADQEHQARPDSGRRRGWGKPK